MSPRIWSAVIILVFVIGDVIVSPWSNQQSVCNSWCSEDVLAQALYHIRNGLWWSAWRPKVGPKKKKNFLADSTAFSTMLSPGPLASLSWLLGALTKRWGRIYSLPQITITSEHVIFERRALKFIYITAA